MKLSLYPRAAMLGEITYALGLGSKLTKLLKALGDSNINTLTTISRWNKSVIIQKQDWQSNHLGIFYWALVRLVKNSWGEEVSNELQANRTQPVAIIDRQNRLLQRTKSCKVYNHFRRMMIKIFWNLFQFISRNKAKIWGSRCMGYKQPSLIQRHFVLLRYS